MKNSNQRKQTSSAQPSRSSTSRTSQASEENAQNYEQSFIRLLNVGQRLWGQTQGVTEHLALELAQITQGQAQLSLYCRETAGRTSQQSSPAGSTSFPVQCHDLIYGMLYIQNNPAHPTQPVISPARAYLLAQLCGYILYSLEVSAFLQFQNCYLSLQLPDPLTKREQEVLNLVCRGLSKEAIAELLSISSKTVNTHLRHLYEKFHVHNEHDLPLAAFRAGLFLPLEGVSSTRSHV